MAVIEALETVQLGPGAVLELSADQARVRAHALRIRDDGRYEAIGPVEFKRGEIFGYDGVVPKAVRLVVAVDGEPSVPAPEPKKPRRGR